MLPLIKYFVENHQCNYNIITWHKTNPIPACGNKYLTDTEYCLFFREKGVKLYGSFDTKFTYYVTPLNAKDKKLYKHPTVKPLNIIKNFVINSSNENDIVLDPFMGSGTTPVASKELNRHYIGFEINQAYYNIAKERLNYKNTSIELNLNKNESNDIKLITPITLF
nr:MAG TPA: adenine-specific methyltransferase [Caudoviricetes sp.]